MNQQIITLTKNELPNLLNDFGFEHNKKHRYDELDYAQLSCDINYFSNVKDFLDSIDVSKIEALLDSDKNDNVKKITVRIFDKLKPDEKYIFDEYKGKAYIFEFKVKNK